MISTNDIYELYDYFGRIIRYGIVKGYSSITIEQYISKSEIADDLENYATAAFLHTKTIQSVLSDIYQEQIDMSIIEKLDVIDMWVGEAYIRLFFKYQKSFEYIFLYIPLEDMLHRFDVYHEMDWSQLYEYFEENIKKTALLRKLIKTRNVSINKLSVMTGINATTLNYYCLDDNNIYKTNNSNLYLLSFALDVKINIFSIVVHSFSNIDYVGVDKRDPVYLSFLGLLFASYYSLEISNANYVFNKDDNIFLSEESVLKIISTPGKSLVDIDDSPNEELIYEINQHSSTKDKKVNVLVAFEFNHIAKSAKPYIFLIDKCGFDKLIIINQQFVILITKNKYETKEISDRVNAMLIERAKKLTLSERNNIKNK